MHSVNSAYEDLCNQCQSERARYQREGTVNSPACAQLFRNAITGDREAWAALHQALWVECLAWFVRWTQAYPWMVPEELTQDVWLKLQTHPPTQPTLGDDISPAMAYLRSCAFRRFLMERRKDKHRISSVEISLDHPAPNSESDVAFGETLATDHGGSEDFAEEVDLRLSVQRLISDLFSDCQKHILLDVFVLKKPRNQIASDHPECFENVGQVFEATRTVKNKLATNADFQALVGQSTGLSSSKGRPNSQSPLVLASLYSGTSHNEADTAMNAIRPCDVGESDLLDYVLGHASLSIKTVIETSPACIEATHNLAQQIEHWLPILRHVTCPDVDNIVDYFENHLESGPRLVIGRHVQQCVHCQEELKLLGKMADDVAPQPRIRHVIKALFISATQRAHALRGELLQFETDRLRITLDRTRAQGKALRWTLSGEVRTRDGLPVTALREVIVTQIDQQQEVRVTSFAEVIETEGLFSVEGLIPGDYSVQMHLVDSAASAVEVIELQGTLHLGDAFTRS